MEHRMLIDGHELSFPGATEKQAARLWEDLACALNNERTASLIPIECRVELQRRSGVNTVWENAGAPLQPPLAAREAYDIYVGFLERNHRAQNPFGHDEWPTITLADMEALYEAGRRWFHA